MARVLVNVQNYMFADMMRCTLEKGDFNVTIVEKTEEVIREFNRTASNIVVFEVTKYSQWRFAERMKLRNQIKHIDPDCKVVFLVDERTEPAAARQVRQAMSDGLINQFIYMSISSSYLLGIIETLNDSMPAVV